MENYKFKKIESNKNKFVYEVTVEYSEYKKIEDMAFAAESKHVKIPGFRPGQAPKEMMQKEVASKVFNRAINTALPMYAEEVMVKEELSPISHLHYDLKELEEEKGMVFTFEVVVQPVINPNDFKKIKFEEPKIEVKKEEAIDVIKNMIRSRVDATKIQYKEVIASEEKKENELKDFDLTDELVAELKYEDTKTVEELIAKVTETLTSIKKEQSATENNNKVLEEAIKIADFVVPHEMIDDQVDGMEEDFKNRLKQIKLSLDSYLQTQGTTLEDVRKTWATDAEFRIASDLLLVNLAVKEELVATGAEVEAEIESMEDPKLKARYSNQSNKDYLRTLMTRERGFQRLLDIVKGIETKKEAK